GPLTSRPPSMRSSREKPTFPRYWAGGRAGRRPLFEAASRVLAHQRFAEAGGLSMSSGTQPNTAPADHRPTKVVVISHSPLFYWWPVWAVGFGMALLTYMRGDQVAFVPQGTVVERGVQLEGHEGPRDILITPPGQPLPPDSEPEELKQPRLRMMASNNPGIIWA